MCIGTKTDCVRSHGIGWPSFSHVEAYRGLIAGDEEYARVVSASSISFKRTFPWCHRDLDQEDMLSKLSKSRWSRHCVGFREGEVSGGEGRYVSAPKSISVASDVKMGWEISGR